MPAEPVFEVVDGGFAATELASGPWDPGAQIGGAPAALLARAFERVPAPEGLVLARLTYDFIRPAPIGRVEIVANVVRPGRRVQFIDGAMLSDGVEVVRARAVRVLAADPGPMHAEETAPPGPVAGPGPDAAVPPPGPVAGWTGPPGPDAGWTGPLPGLHRPRFATDAVEVRFIAGAFGGGPATAWFRLIRPLVTAEEPTPLQRLAAAADFGAGLSSTLPRERYLFINTDLTLYVEREPVGEWICLDSQTRIASGGVGVTESVLYDLRGRVGRATQALLIAPR